MILDMVGYSPFPRVLFENMPIGPPGEDPEETSPCVIVLVLQGLSSWGYDLSFNQGILGSKTVSDPETGQRIVNFK